MTSEIISLNTGFFWSADKYGGKGENIEIMKNLMRCGR